MGFGVFPFITKFIFPEGLTTKSNLSIFIDLHTCHHTYPEISDLVGAAKPQALIFR